MFVMRRWRVRIFAAVWITYFSYYLCRLNMPVAKAPLCGAFDLDAAGFGQILSALTVMYAVGQFVNGLLADRFGTRIIATIGCAGSVAMNLAVYALVMAAPGAAMSNAAASRLLVVFWGMNGFFQAMGWSPMVKVMTHWFPLEGRGKVMGWLGTCYQFGAAFAQLLAIFLVGYYARQMGGDWRAVFLVPAIIFAAVGILFFLLIRNRPEDAGLSPVNGNAAAAAPGESPTRQRTILENIRAILGNTKLWIVAGVFFLLDVNRYGFVNWLPAYITDSAGPEAGSTLLGNFKDAMKICIHPVAGSVGAVLGGWATDRFFGGRRAPVIALFLAALGIFSILVTRLDTADTLLVTAVVALIGFCTYGAHVLMVCHAAQDFGRKKGAAGAAGFIDALGYVGASLAGWGAGALIKRFCVYREVTDGAGKTARLLMDPKGYHITFITAGVCALAGALLICVIWKAKPQAED